VSTIQCLLYDLDWLNIAIEQGLNSRTVNALRANVTLSSNRAYAAIMRHALLQLAVPFTWSQK
jgi:hypothetical protein